MSEIDKIVAFNVLMRMREMGLDQKTLAKKAKVTAAYLNKLVKNKKPISKSPKLPDIAKALGISETKLYVHQRERLGNLATRLSLAMKDILRKNHKDESFRPSLSLPPEVIANWDSAGSIRQAICLFLLTREDRFAHVLGNEIVSHLEAVLRIASHARQPKKKAP